MGVSLTHYIILGIAITDKAQIKKYFNISEEMDYALEEFDDNAYEDEVTQNITGIHIIADGMACKYVVIGKIIVKDKHGLNLDETMGLKEIEEIDKTTRDQIFKEISKLDFIFDTKFTLDQLKYLIFTHWH